MNKGTIVKLVKGKKILKNEKKLEWKNKKIRDVCSIFKTCGFKKFVDVLKTF